MPSTRAQRQSSLSQLSSGNFQRCGIPSVDSEDAQVISEALLEVFQANSGARDDFQTLRALLKSHFALRTTVTTPALRLVLSKYARMSVFQPYQAICARLVAQRRSSAAPRAMRANTAIENLGQASTLLSQKFADGLLRDKGDIRLTCNPDQHVFVSSPGSPPCLIQVTLANLGRLQRVITGFGCLASAPLSSVRCPVSERMPLPPNRHVMLTLTLTATFSNAIHPPFLFVVNFGTFQIGRLFNFNIQDEEIQQLRAQHIPFVPSVPHKAPHLPIESEADPLPGAGLKFKQVLKDAKRPSEPMKSSYHRILEDSNPLTPENYYTAMETLWLVEELHLIDDLAQFNMSRATLAQLGSRNVFVLVVPGLAEQRPSVLRGDLIKVQTPFGKLHLGRVSQVRQLDLCINMSRKFQDAFLPNMKFGIFFQLNRRMLNLRHRIIEKRSQKLLQLAFPASFPALPMVNFERDCANEVHVQRFLNADLNREQETAVLAILKRLRAPDPTPFIVFGPPGTGKTSTMVEAICQSFLRYPSAKIIACAPSNAAADLLLDRCVSALGPARAHRQIVLRANAAHREKLGDDAMTVVCDYSHWDAEQEIYTLPTNLHTFRLVFCTLGFASTIMDVSFPGVPSSAKSFDQTDFVFVDEAGHADELETLLAVASIRPTANMPRVVLAGDPYQLGPLIRAPVAVKHGFAGSLLERLMNSPPYQSNRGVYHSGYVVKLVKNYRSHTSLLQVPNQLFYENQLRAFASPDRTGLFLNWSELPNPDIPLIFHNVHGRHEQEKSSPSFFNLEEMKEVRRFIDLVLHHTSSGTQPHQTGVIAPYRKQCEKIRNDLTRNRGWEKVRVGTVESFQGDEKRVIIISTVRSVTSGQPDELIQEFLQFDREHSLGFLNNPKRFNVSITRPQALLVIVGNAEMLSCDRHWRTLLEFAVTNRCMSGRPFNAAAESENRFLAQFQALGLNEHDGSDSEED